MGVIKFKVQRIRSPMNLEAYSLKVPILETGPQEYFILSINSLHEKLKYKVKRLLSRRVKYIITLLHG